MKFALFLDGCVRDVCHRFLLSSVVDAISTVSKLRLKNLVVLLQLINLLRPRIGGCVTFAR